MLEPDFAITGVTPTLTPPTLKSFIPASRVGTGCVAGIEDPPSVTGLSISTLPICLSPAASGGNADISTVPVICPS
ncbi:hypothetical protein [Peribacillus butanolivorans]|uniref:hypothetical protein n=1 Tax=Peribacillus butanolivorans TaxID=421767 RepID=UPI0036A1D366